MHSDDMSTCACGSSFSYGGGVPGIVDETLGSGVCEAGFAFDDAHRVVEDSSGACARL